MGLEAPIYGRYGYGLASFCGSVNIERDRSRFAASIERKGRTRLLNEDAAASRLPGIWDRARRSTPGMLARSETWWRLRRLSDPEWVRKGRGDLQRVVLEIDGRDEAYALYRLAFELHNGIIVSPVEVIEAIGTTAESTALIWKYLFELDVVKTIRASLLPVDHPLFLLLAEPRRMGFTVSDALWVRIADVAAALAARTYAREDAIVFDLEDRFCPSNSGRYRLDGGTRRPNAPANRLTFVSPLRRLAPPTSAGFLLRVWRSWAVWWNSRMARSIERMRFSTLLESRGARKFSERHRSISHELNEFND